MKYSRVKKFICMLMAALLVTGSVAFASTKEVGPGIVYVPPCDELFALVNTRRAMKDLEPLIWSDELAAVANIRAKELSESFSHTRPNGTEPQTAYKENNISFSVAGENIAAGREEAWEVMMKWEGTKASRNNILRENFYFTAIGTYDVIAEDGTVTRYWAIEFMTPKLAPELEEGADIPSGDVFPSADIPETDLGTD